MSDLPEHLKENLNVERDIKMPKERKIFFKSESERDLWIKLNAEVVKYVHESKGIMHADLGDINKEHTPMWISKNQLDYDEHESEKLRFSFEDLLTLSMNDLAKISKKQAIEFIKKNISSFDEEIEDIL